MNFEIVPSDFTSLKIHTLPETGGDTMFASGYDLYDRLSPAWKNMVDGLTGSFADPGFQKTAQLGIELYTLPRGSPENIGSTLEAIHPVHDIPPCLLII